MADNLTPDNVGEINEILGGVIQIVIVVGALIGLVLLIIFK